jgi:anaphase-promoting complex subunit 2
MNTPESRIHLTTKFQEEIERRLLHAGATTRQILDVYMLIIQAFTALDSRGVLLDNVSRPIRKYLKGRQDTAGIVIRSMLTDITDAGKEVTEMDISAAIAGEMLKPLTLNPDSQKRYHELDFDSMDYMPQPNDASADFRKNESVNAINHLLSLYDREHFVSTLQDIFGEHLLKIGGDVHFDRETQLLELFKSRFGDEKLQACEVMLRDMTISKRMNAQIHRTRDYMFGSDRQGLRETKLDSQILSRFFWPDLRDDQFAVPAPVKELQSLYEKGFGSRYNLMKLKWLPSLGRVKVALELHDREVREEVPTWVASIIYAFNGGDEKTPTTKTIQQLQDELSMDEALVKNGVSYWITNKVLHETQSGVFSVLETLAHSRTPFAAPTLMHDAVPAVKSAEDKFEENSHIYRQFVQGMLTNRGAMNLATILMMLKMAIPAGFPFGETELRGLLQGMVDEAKLVVQGDVYSVKKA